MTKIDLMYIELNKYKRKFNISRIITLVLVFFPFILGYVYKKLILVGLSIIILIFMVSLIGIPTLKKINELKKKINVAEGRTSWTNYQNFIHSQFL